MYAKFITCMTTPGLGFTGIRFEMNGYRSLKPPILGQDEDVRTIVFFCHESYRELLIPATNRRVKRTGKLINEATKRVAERTQGHVKKVFGTK